MEWNESESSNQNPTDQNQNASTSGRHLEILSHFHHPQNHNIVFNQAVPPHQPTRIRNQFDVAAGRGNVSHSQQFRHQLSWNTQPTYSYENQQHYAAVNPAQTGLPPFANQQVFDPQHTNVQYFQQPSAISSGQSVNQFFNPQTFHPQYSAHRWWNQQPLPPNSVQTANPQAFYFNPSQSGSQQMHTPQWDQQCRPSDPAPPGRHHVIPFPSQDNNHPIPYQQMNVPPQIQNDIPHNTPVQQPQTSVCTYSVQPTSWIRFPSQNIICPIVESPPPAYEEPQLDLTSYKHSLKNAAKNQCSSKNFLILTMKQIKICLMEITDKPSRKFKPAEYQTPQKHRKLTKFGEEDGHYNRREEYEKISLKEESKVSVESLFHLAKQQASKSNDPECSGNVVALIGQPGIGKTTLSKVITENILEDKMESIANFEWVFYISVKYVNFENPVTLVDFLLKYSLDNTQYNNKLSGNKTPDLQEALLKELFVSTNVFIAFVGLDEASANWDLEYIGGLNLRKKNNPLLYLFGLMNGDILPQAKKLFTSRQNHFFSIDANHRPRFVAEVLGLNTKSQESLCKQICPDHKDQVWKIIKSNPNLSYSCYVPAKCLFIVYSIWKSLKEHSGERFHSLTHVFAYGFKYYFANGFVKKIAKDEKYMDKIATLAWNGFKQKKSVFQKMDLDAVGIDFKTFVDILSAFVTEENWDMRILDCDRKSSFSHLTWQEYFAACYLVYFASVDEFCKFIPQFKSNRWEVVAKFVFGLFNSEVSQVAKTCFLTTNQNEQEFQTKKKKLSELACDEMKVCAEGTNKKSRKKLLQVCSWLQESNDDKFYQEVVSFLCQDIVLTGNILLTDVSSIAEVLSHSQTKHDIKIGPSCKFHNGSLRIFLQNLKKLNIKVKSLKITIKVTDESASAIASCIHNIEELSLDYSQLTSFGICEIAKAISKLSQPMRKLDLDGITIDEEAEKSLFGCLHNIQDELTVRTSGISADFESKYSRLPEPKPKLTCVQFIKPLLVPASVNLSSSKTAVAVVAGHSK